MQRSILALLPSLLPVLTLSAGVAACHDNDDAAHAQELWSGIQTQNYRAWRRAPGYPYRKASFTAHARSVDIYVNDVVQKAIDAEQPLDAWPLGSIIVKDAFSGDALSAVAALEKRENGWFWAEYHADGDPVVSGAQPDDCVPCHSRSAYDSVWAFGLPK